jgi:hypothetical protein
MIPFSPMSDTRHCADGLSAIPQHQLKTEIDLTWTLRVSISFAAVRPMRRREREAAELIFSEREVAIGEIVGLLI